MKNKKAKKEDKAANLKVAFAHLTSRVKQALVAVLSVTFGISMYIFMIRIAK